MPSEMRPHGFVDFVNVSHQFWSPKTLLRTDAIQTCVCVNNPIRLKPRHYVFVDCGKHYVLQVVFFDELANAFTG